MTDDTALGDRMKRYEAAQRTILPRRTYTLLRVDGRAFHTYLRDAQRPFDEGFMADMDAVAEALCAEISGSVFAYTHQAEKNRTAPCCQAGAISRAAFGVAWRDSGIATAADSQVLAFGKAGHYMLRYVQQTSDATSIEWNDRPERTASDVVAALRGAADDAREAGE
ncbi:tRNA(His) guanylyltransferase Thg1 family protein [Streptomyces sp. NPDC002057]|uniref:DUF6197 family protein n=1 Tax=Streptomyces sp. NPDC002057 TaxID=3154664 RepID=UPI00332E988F